VRGALRSALAELGRPLRVLAEGLHGVSGEIDLLAVDPGGTPVLVLVAADPGEALGLVARALAERHGLGRHIEDWLKLAPDLGLRPDAGPEVLLLAPEFGPAARAAAVEAGRGIQLARLRFVALDGASPEVLVETLDARPAGPERPRERPRLSVFRSGLEEGDLPEPRSVIPVGG
jgi:hypothetical protein